MDDDCSRAVGFQGDFPPLDRLSPTEFERLVKNWFEKVGGAMESFEAAHLETLPGGKGDYTFDVTVRFKAFQGCQFLVLVECKKHKNPIKREVVQVLHDRLRSVGGHKGVVFATTSFQSGAVDYAEEHGIALIQVISGAIRLIRATADRDHLPVSPDKLPCVGCHLSRLPEGRVLFDFIADDDVSVLKSLLCLPEE